MRLIDSDAYQRKLEEMLKDGRYEVIRYDWETGYWIHYKSVEDIIKDFSTIEAEPIKHGHVIMRPDAYDCCSVCGWEIYCKQNYCDNCGAKMDEEAERDDNE